MTDTAEGSDTAGSSAQPSWTIRVLGRFLAGLMTLAALAEAAALNEIVGYAPYDEARYLWYLGIGIAALFILKPARKDAPRLRVPVYDAIIAAVGFATCMYASWHYERILESMADSPPESFVVGLIIVCIVGEGLRRTAGGILFGFMVFFVLFGLVGHHVPAHSRAIRSISTVCSSISGWTRTALSAFPCAYPPPSSSLSSISARC